MRNIETHNFDTDVEALAALMTKARMEERRERAAVTSDRLVELAVHIQQQGLNSVEAAELIRREAERYQHEVQELH